MKRWADLWERKLSLATQGLRTVLALLGGCAACEVAGGTFETRLPALEAVYRYSDFRGPVIVDLGTRLLSLTNVVVRLSGLHTNGWWVGDGVWDPYVGPQGARLVVYMDSGTPSFARWANALRLTNDGPFSATVPLWGGVPWDFLRDGVTDLELMHDAVFGAEGGGFTLPPFLEVTNVVLSIEATPQVIVRSLAPDGTLTWSALPTDGISEIESAVSPRGPWRRELLLTDNICSLRLEIREDTRSRFFRVKWTAGPRR
jgi:hypothetical protein